MMCDLNVIPWHYNLLTDLRPKDELKHYSESFFIEKVTNLNFLNDIMMKHMILVN